MIKAADRKEVMPEIYDIIRSPLVTEKSQAGSEVGKVTFRVAPLASKDKIKKAVETIFGVNVKKVNIIVVKGKEKLFRGRSGKRSDVKKAIVTLADGQTIDMSSAV